MHFHLFVDNIYNEIIFNKKKLYRTYMTVEL